MLGDPVEVRMGKTVQPVLGTEERDAVVTVLRAVLRRQVLVEHDADLVRGAVEGLTHAPEGPRITDNPGATALGAFRRESATSRLAALRNYPRSGSQRLSVLLRVAKRGGKGATREELATWLDLGVSSINPRVRELIDGGWLCPAIRDSGDVVTRKTQNGSAAEVLVLTDYARGQLHRRGVTAR